jgi:hypothetical protein
VIADFVSSSSTQGRSAPSVGSLVEDIPRN